MLMESSQIVPIECRNTVGREAHFYQHVRKGITTDCLNGMTAFAARSVSSSLSAHREEELLTRVTVFSAYLDPGECEEHIAFTFEFSKIFPLPEICTHAGALCFR